jgi:exodeoxyribonuclease VII large subunit
MEQRLTLTGLQNIIRDSIVLAMPGYYWVTAEIAEIKINYSGHCYLEIIEKNPTGNNIRARARATIWAARYRSLRPLFESATGETLREGLKILLKATVEYHELYGLSLNITEIDPAYTVGEMAMKRAEIIRRLTEEGIINMNGGHELPLLPKRIAVVSSSSAAGYTDFQRQLTGNSFGYSFVTELFNSPMQGEETERGIISALDLIAARADSFDLVTILRGGGSSTDLHWFDNYSIAFHITQFPLPVITGIGHDKDITVTDIVAWEAFKTPTAVAAFLIERMHETDVMISTIAGRFDQASKSILVRSNSLLDSMARRILPATSTLIKTTRSTISSATMNLSTTSRRLTVTAETHLAVMKSALGSSTKRIINTTSLSLTNRQSSLITSSRLLISQKKEELNSREGQAKLADPQNILRKGFSMTKRDGKIIKSALELQTGDHISTRFHDGAIESNVVSTDTNTQDYDQKRDDV